jgi:hypothetical protein
MFCTSGLVFGGFEGIRSRFSSFASPYSFFMVSRTSGPIFIFCAPRLIFGGNEGVRSPFHILPARTHFLRYQGRRVPFSCFALPGSFSEVRRASGLVFMFCTSRLIFGGSEGVGCRFHVLLLRTYFQLYRGRRVQFSYFRCRTCFRRCGGRRVQFSRFALPDSFSAVPRASGHVFMFCAPGFIFSGIEVVGFRFYILRARTHFRRYRGRWVPFSYLARPDSFSTVSRASAPVFMF